MSERELSYVLAALGRPRVLIVGDLILDRYVWGSVERISPEAPIPVLAARHTEVRLGGAGNVAANLRAMEAEVEILGIVGRDDRGTALLELFDQVGVARGGVLALADRPTTEKARMLGGGSQMLRVDWEEARALPEDQARALIGGIEGRLDGVGAVVLSDYGKGVLTKEVIRAVVRAARAARVPVLVDPKGSDYSRYEGATLITPNRKEAEEALHGRLADLSELPRAARGLVELAKVDAAVITLGADGIFWSWGERAGRVPAVARAVFDVTGAGDTVIAHLALGLASKIEFESAVRLANHAAGIVVGKRGAASVTRAELAAALGERSRATNGVLTRAELPLALAEWRAEGKRIVFTNGCFDVLHAGHVAYLRDARSRGDVLVVGVNDDESVRRLKGSGRPINPLADRLDVLAALEMVDAVVPFGEDTPGRIIEEITPDVLVKGQDWEEKGVVGREWVERHGGIVVLAPLLPGRSTSAIAERLRALGGKPADGKDRPATKKRARS